MKWPLATEMLHHKLPMECLIGQTSTKIGSGVFARPFDETKFNRTNTMDTLTQYIRVFSLITNIANQLRMEQRMNENHIDHPK
ncbi:hypothetical protein BLOT_000173 [Blomia tropicalis]|nr:hypothetical protein BLOT_000173 [Blomia tropicalis]